MALEAIESATAVIGNVHLVYPKDDAEAANTEYREDIRKLKAENDRLERELTEQQKAYCVLDAMYQRDTGIACKAIGTGSVDCKILRTTQRALWMARAKRASEKADTFITFKVTYNGLCNINNNVWPEKGAKRMLECDDWLDVWTHVWDLCTKKAQEYK